jgi:hypothetical protein
MRALALRYLLRFDDCVRPRLDEVEEFLAEDLGL